VLNVLLCWKGFLPDAKSGMARGQGRDREKKRERERGKEGAWVNIFYFNLENLLSNRMKSFNILKFILF